MKGAERNGQSDLFLMVDGVQKEEPRGGDHYRILIREVLTGSLPSTKIY